MATWTTLPDAALEPGKPIRSIDGLALRDNPVAITEGAVGAPQIQTAALTAGERMNTTNVLNATASASVGSVGSYAFATRPSNDGSTPGNAIDAGQTVAGSVLRYSNSENGLSSALSGTWRCMGSMQAFVVSVGYGVVTIYGATLFLRIS